MDGGPVLGIIAPSTHFHLHAMPVVHRCALLCIAGLLAQAAGAQTLKDPALEALYKAGRYDELQQVSAARAATQADDAQAVLGLALAALARDAAPPRQAAIQRAQACIDKQPRAAVCHYALGAVLGVQAMSEGLFKAARSAGTIRDALATAYQIDPSWYPARSALSEFYLLAPGMMGGSMAKAAELARSAPAPEQTQLLQARAATADKKFDAAVRGFLALPAGLDPALADDLLTWGVECALDMLGSGQAAQAQPLLDRLMRDFPQQAGPVYMLARVRAEAGAHEEALQLFERAATLKGADTLPVAYRTGIAQQQLGRKDAARASFTRYISAGKGQKAALDDARKRLEQLGA